MIKLAKNNYTGKLIVFEGTDGAGKTTMINKTVDYLKNFYEEDMIVVEKQPTDLSRKTKLFQKMIYSKAHDDISYRAMQLLTLSDRVQHNHEIIIPALKSGKVVICDRYIYTSVANMLARGYKNEKWFYMAAKEIIKPDIIFLAYVEPKVAIERIKLRPDECNRHLDVDQLNKVAIEFLKLSKSEKITCLNTEKMPEETFEKVEEELKKRGII